MDVKTLDIDIDYEKLLNEYNDNNFQQKLIDMERISGTGNQISLQKTDDCAIERELYDSCGSLFFNWDTYDPKKGNDSLVMKDKPRTEKEFNVTCSEFEGTYLGEVIDLVHAKFDAVRGRMMALDWKTCLTIHKDKTKRIHIPLITDKNCFMMIDDVPHRLEFGNTYLTDTTKFHTAINASKIYRTHLVFCTDMFKEPRVKKPLPWEV